MRPMQAVAAAADIACAARQSRQWTRKFSIAHCRQAPAAARAVKPQARPRCHSLDRYRQYLRQQGRELIYRSYADSSASSSLRRTPLYDLHTAHGAKMVPFAGYSMPVSYSDLGVGESHKWTREKASLFDVSHMVQHRLSGPLAQSLLERITPSDITSLKTRHSTLSCLLHPVTGGIVDDTVIARLGPEAFYIVTNAANRDKDLQYLTAQIEEQQAAHSGLTAGISWEVLDDWSLIAVQGPRSGDILSSILDKPEDFDLKSLYFGQCAYLHIRLPSTPGIAEVLVSRGGYTGEDGFEISIPPSLPTIGLIESMLDSAEGKENLRLAGLGARDSLRLEAGMCLYGHDLDDTTTPVEAGLSWIIGKTRRTGGGFHGDQTILSQLKPKKDGGSGVERRRVGFIVDGAPAREGAAIVEADGQVVGTITSGCPSPTLGKNVAMGYVKDGWHKRGTELGVMVRGKKRRAVVTKMPFVESRYWKQAAGTAPG